jgi:hypothetical protein
MTGLLVSDGIAGKCEAVNDGLLVSDGIAGKCEAVDDGPTGE